MPPRHAFTIAGAVADLDTGVLSSSRRIKPGWDLQLTANGRDVLHFDILSPDGTYAPGLDDEVLLHVIVPISTSSIANPGVINTTMPHGLVSGDTVQILGHSGSTPSINGTDYTATVISPTSLSIPVNITLGGVGGELYRRIFGGTIDPPEKMSGDGEGGGRAILTSADAIDFNAMTERRFVNEILPEGTLKSMLTILRENYLPECTLHPNQVDGPTIGVQTLTEWPVLQEVLNLLSSLSGGYVFDIDGYKRLKMALPTTVAAPFNINNDVLGTPRIKPTRSNYANRIILRFSAAAQPARAYLIGEPSPGVHTTGNFANNETVTIDGKVYTFQTTLTDVDGHVKIGGSMKSSLANLTRAIAASVKVSHGPGINYANATTEHPTVIASQGILFGDLVGMAIRAKVAGAAGNSIGVSETSANAYWRSNTGVTSTMKDGVDQELTNVVIVEDEAEQAPPTGIWEKVVEAPNVLEEDVATILANAVLTASILVPNEIVYPTYGVGLRPGQTQTIVLDKYGLNGLFLIIDVNVRHLEGELVVYEVTAIEDPLLQAADRWRDFYRQITGSGGGNLQIGAVSLSVPPATSTAPTLISFGGSAEVWYQTTSGAWIDASSIEVTLNPVLHGTTFTCYVRIAARSGSVTARMQKKSGTPVTVGTSAAVSSGTLTTVAFTVTLTEAGTYGIQISPSVSNEDIQMGSGYMEKVV